MDAFNCLSANILASGKSIFDGKRTRFMAENISPILDRAGEVVTGDTSTIKAFSTSCGWK